MPLRWFGHVLGLLLVFSVPTSAEEVAPNDPYWTLIHDQAVLADLKLTQAQRLAWRQTLDRLDLRCFPLRNRSAAEASKGFSAVQSEAKAELVKILKAQQALRLEQIVTRAQGTDALLRDDIVAKLKLTEKQV